MCERIEVSIIIPVYNEEKQISHCLDSIQCQEYKNYEVIIVDDGSIDKTGEICDSYAKKDSRFKVIHEANGGVSVARNKGIDVATGKLLMFVDSDDFVKPDFINNYVKMQSESDADVIIDAFDGKLTEAHLKYIDNAAPGTGLIRFGNIVIPMDNRIDKDNIIYDIFNTNFQEKAALRMAQREKEGNVG